MVKLNQIEFKTLLENQSLPKELQKELASKAIKERWSFVGT
jgi:hypothetical protein